MTANVATITIEPDFSGLREALAAGLRQIADDLDAAAAARQAPEPPRYVAARDRDGDLSVLDREEDRDIPGLGASLASTVLDDLRHGSSWEEVLASHDLSDVHISTYAPHSEVTL